MSTTFGQVCHRASKLPTGAGIDRVVLEGVVNDRYKTVLNAYPFSRTTQVEYILQTVALYETGTIAVTTATTALTGTDTVWTSAMTGRRIRIAGRNEWYIFTYVSATSATIDRNFEGGTETAATYQIWQPVYALPSNLDVLESVKIFGDDRDLDQIDLEELDKLDPARLRIEADADAYAFFEDDTSSPPLPQIELWPGPQNAIGVPIRYTERIDAITSTSTIFPQWINIECIFAGVEADLCRLARDYAGYTANEARFQSLLIDQIRRETNRRPPVVMKVAERFTAHRINRTTGDLDIASKLRRMQ